MNHEAPPFKSRTDLLPWRLGQSDFNEILDFAGGKRWPIAVVKDGDRLTLSVSNRIIGLLDSKKLDFIRWPSITDNRSIADILHASADKGRTSGKCYFIGGETGFIKIGFSVDVPGRLKALQMGSPVLLRVLAVRDGGQDRECAYHEQFRETRQHGEWFERTPELLAEIERLNAPAFTIGTELEGVS